MPIRTAEQLEQMLTFDEFMNAMSIKSRNTVHRWIDSRMVKSVKVGRRRLFPVSEVARLTKPKYGL